MPQSLLHVALVVRDYDEAIAFFCGKLHFLLVEDTYQPEQDKRWVVVAPPGSSGTTLLLARASTPEQESAIGRQTGGRVFLFLRTDDFWRDERFGARGPTASWPASRVFGRISGRSWGAMVHKHLDHHLRQFGVWGAGSSRNLTWPARNRRVEQTYVSAP